MARRTESREFSVSARGEGSESEVVSISVTALDGHSGGLLGIRLLQLLGPSVAGLVTAMQSSDPSKAVSMAGTLFEKVTPSEFKAIQKQLLAHSTVTELGETQELSDAWIAERFSGHVGSLFALVGFALKVNYENFFEDLGIKALLAKAPRSKAP